jgi:dolichol-phosphate mannosyltransferase
VAQTLAESYSPALAGAAVVTRTLPTTHVLLPAYNEAASLPSLFERLGALGAACAEHMTVWVVDDGSSDGTAEIARQGHALLDVRVVSHPVNLGLGQAVHSGLCAALAAADENDVVVVMDADDTHDVGLVPVLRRAVTEGADLAIASRFVPGGDDATAPTFRRVLSRGAATLFRASLPLDGVADFTSGYRAYRVGLLKRATGHYGERLIEERGFACMVELLLKLRHCHPVIVEVPLVLRYDRKQSASKLRLGRTMMQYLKLLIRDRLAPPPFRGL